MERPPFKRKGNDPQDGSRKSAKSGDAAGKKLSFAERQMLKMGWKKGEGLGASGEGIREPVTVTVRPAKVGVGAVSEKTDQHKREEKRAAERRGETYVDSSEEEREAEKRRRKIRKGLIGSSAASAASTPGRIKQKYRVADLEADGLQVPSTLKEMYLDMSGVEKRLTDSSELRLRGGVVSAESETAKIARRAKRDLEAYAEAWNALSEESKTIDFQETQLIRDLATLEAEIDEAQRAKEAARELPGLSTLDDVLSKLETIPAEYRDETIAIAAVHPLLRDAMSSWAPLEIPNSTDIIPQLTRLDGILKRNKDALALRHEVAFSKPRKRSTTPWESLITTLLLPKLRKVLLEWDTKMPSSMIALIQTIEPLLPRFVYNNVLNELVAKLSRAIHDFNPRLALKKKSKGDLPHLWVIPMLQLLPDHLTAGLLSAIRGKLRTMLNLWDISRGPLPGLGLWREVLPDLDRMLITSVLPRLSGLLRSDFEVNPVDQNLDPLLQVLSFQSEFSQTIMCELLIAEFFPKLLAILHQWLEGEPNYEEVGQFYLWWKEQIPQELNELRAVEDQWEKGLQMINLAIDGKLEAYSEGMEQPGPETPRPINTPSKEPARQKEVVEATFKDIVEEWCGEENLLLIPLREAHPTTGLPLFRITANAIGRGGVVVYMRGDVLYATEKKDRSKWKPLGLGAELVEKAEGK
ncbi:TFP11-domain-containing protein [Melanomma pulvis-pyrius CBS 109.77]|uniref:TFP11-domain-containing protein n=1 Tax=Melanomma pulvis-pyrius CBS 109.77 TaxID=1314802 RepID=A0A6A6XQM2_9PLEO|nr:TFP11-domain-containing protein [Melanomma pulvis-pyrius CBS 109.77]